MSTKPDETPQEVDGQIESCILGADRLQELLDVLCDRGYAVVGPTARDGSIAYERIERVDELPRDMADEQGPGRYRLGLVDGSGFFAHAVGAQSWKRFLSPPMRSLWTAERIGASGAFEITSEEVPGERFAFLGVRGCDLAAIAIQDRIFLEGPFRDPVYAERRNDAFIVAVNCTRAAATCFCTSTGTGPHVESGFDLLLTELVDDGRHEFLVEAAGAAGRSVLAELPGRPASETDMSEAAGAVERAKRSIRKSLETADVHDLLLSNLDHVRYKDVAERCLACGNCTMVCPTCFCITTEDVTDLLGQRAERRQKWDSCFTLEHSFIHGGSVRTSIRARYRQWLTHKLATWVDQFGVSGCVGCGRCITWCPVGIDITEEVRAIRETAARPGRAR